MEDTTEQPTTSSWVTVSNEFDETETGFLTAYLIITSFLTLVLNAYLIYVIVFKISLRKSGVFIPIFTASLLGLIHGVSINLLVTASFINKGWVGAQEWCWISGVLHQYLVYDIVYCQTVTSIEAAYLISHPHEYSRSTPKAKRAMILATVFAVFIYLPVFICHFFYLQPSSIKEHPDYQHEYYQEIIDTKVFFYDEDMTFLCYRYFFPGTLDRSIIIYIVLILNFTAVFLIMGSFLVIIRIVLKMQYRRSGPNNNDIQTSARHKKQNRKIALRAILTTVSVALPWAVNNIYSLLTEIPEFRNFWYSDKVPMAVKYGITYFMVYSYYLVPVTFPLMNIIANPSISKITKTIISNIEQHTIVPLSMAVHQQSAVVPPQNANVYANRLASS